MSNNIFKFKEKDTDDFELETSQVTVTTVENGWLVNLELEDNEASYVFSSREDLMFFLEAVL